jgi:hypothetical protein
MRHRVLLLSCAAAGLIAAADPGTTPREDAYRANNVGIGLLEQYRHDLAADAFRRALKIDGGLVIARVNLAIALFNIPDHAAAREEAEAAAALAPSLPQPRYILGLIARGDNRVDDAVAAFQRVLALDPEDVGSNVNLGQIYLQQRRYDEAVAALRKAVSLDPLNSTALYNLGIALTRSGNGEEGQRFLERFRTLRESGVGIVFGQSYPDQGRYAEALASTGAEPDLVDPTTPAVRFTDVTATVLPIQAEKGAEGQGRVTLVDYDGDGDLDVALADPRGQRLLRNDTGRLVSPGADGGFDSDVPGFGVTAGDVDQDGRRDLVVLRPKGPAVFRNEGDGRFVDVTAAARPPELEARVGALVDVDHDGDLDLVLGAGDGLHLLRNDGTAVFTDVTDAAGFAGVAARVVGIAPTDFDNHRDVDLLALTPDGPPVLLENLRDGSFRDAASGTGLGGAKGPFSALAAADVNKDGYMDLFLGRKGTGSLLALSDGRKGFGLTPGPGSDASSAVFVDYDNDGVLDLVVDAGDSLHVYRSLGGGQWGDVTATALPEDAACSSFAAGDVDGDGATDLVLGLASGALRVLRAEGGRNHSLAVRLAGRVSNRNGVGAKIEIRAGSLRQKIETSAATPAIGPADVLFGLGARESADAVRILWPSGVLQTETEPEKIRVRVASIEELDRKPSSCPYLYAWNGERFEFVTDFMGGGEMGYRMAPGAWNVPIPVEYVRLGPEQLRPVKGRYELRVTNELEEGLFVDRLRLLAVDHPKNVLVFPNEGMGAAPRPPFRLYAVRGARPPRRAEDDAGRDVSDRVSALDRRFVDGFPLEAVRGYAKEHWLSVDLAGVPSDRALLLLTGWTDYAFSSDNVAAGQRGLSMRPPSLQMQGDDGRWVTVVDDIGIPVGRPQTVVVDLSGKWPGRSRVVRVVTNMRIYWDRVLVGERSDDRLKPRPLDPDAAVLRERGFSAEVTPDGREPFGYAYDRVSALSPWKAFPGRYTRTGDVRELLLAADDLFVISRPGDEIALSFEASALPTLRPGLIRTFLLHSDGFSKEMDINSATPGSLGPLPFHAMSRYPYEPPEAYPMTPEKMALMERYNTRVVTGPVAPLEVALSLQGEAGR